MKRISRYCLFNITDFKTTLCFFAAALSGSSWYLSTLYTHPHFPKYSIFFHIFLNLLIEFNRLLCNILIANMSHAVVSVEREFLITEVLTFQLNSSEVRIENHVPINFRIQGPKYFPSGCRA